METLTVSELIEVLEKYPKDMKVYYSTKYALVPFSVRRVEEYLLLEMTTEVQELFKD